MDPADALEPRPGPLAGMTVVDVSTMGPGPFASMVLADFGAEVIEIVRPGEQEVDASSQFSRGKKKLTVDLRAPGGAELIARLTDTADVFLEGYRPGTMERRGLGPEVLMGRNPRLVYTRLTGWGQSGPYASIAGHDINYTAIAGSLGATGTERPTVALNLLGDFGGGSFPAVLGTVLALVARGTTGRGQVVDAAMVDGTAYMLSAQFAELARGDWHGRNTNLLAGVAPFYSVYLCADGEWISVGSIENKFYRIVLDKLGLEPTLASTQYDEAQWPQLRERFGQIFAAFPRQHWTELFANTDGCVFPVLNLDEVAADPHVAARQSVHGGAVTPAPRLSETPGRIGATRAFGRDDQVALLRQRGLSDAEVSEFQATGALHLEG